MIQWVEISGLNQHFLMVGHHTVRVLVGMSTGGLTEYFYLFNQIRLKQGFQLGSVSILSEEKRFDSRKKSKVPQRLKVSLGAHLVVDCIIPIGLRI